MAMLNNQRVPPYPAATCFSRHGQRRKTRRPRRGTRKRTADGRPSDALGMASGHRNCWFSWFVINPSMMGQWNINHQ